MADSKWSEQKEEYIESKTKYFLPRRKTSELEKSVEGSARTPSWNHWQTNPKIINGQLDIQLGQFTEWKLDAVLKKKN